MCQRWRNLVFASPRRLDLQLRCTQKRPVREMLDIWPALPIVISGNGFPTSGGDNITAALERNDRVCVIDLWGDLTTILSRSAAAIQKPFPVLFDVDLRSNGEWVAPVSDSFLGGSAPSLRSIRLDAIPFPGIRKLLSSANDLVHLDLWDIPDSGYISPEMMLVSLSSLTQLKTLGLEFHSPRSRPSIESRHSSPQTRVFLLNLTHFWFQGVIEYLEDLVAHVDAPLLHSVRITLFNELSFDVSELPQFINRSEKFTSLNTTRADLTFSKNTVELTLSPQTETVDGIRLTLSISCKESFWPPVSLSHVFGSSLPPLATSERLNIRVEGNWRRLSQWEYALENVEWIDLLRPFTAVKDLYLFEEVALRLAPALEEVAEGSVNDVLPALQNVFFEGLQPTGPVQEAIGRFASARQLSSHPIAVHPWERMP